MQMVLTGLSVVVGLASLACFIMVVMKMFQNEQTGMGIACIVLLFCFGIGALIALIVGWMNAEKWGIKNIMLAWTGLVVVGIILNIIQLATAPKAAILMPMFFG